MLITFKCNAYSNIMMFGSIGLQLVKMMGCGETPSGAIKEENIPEALERLQSALAANTEDTESIDRDDEDGKPIETPVSLAKRAVPLIEMLNAAIKDECGIMWEGK